MHVIQSNAWPSPASAATLWVANISLVQISMEDKLEMDELDPSEGDLTSLGPPSDPCQVSSNQMVAEELNEKLQG